MTCSVVIPSHNYAHYLSDAIESVLAQSTPAAQIIVVDDRSEDNAEEVVDRYPQVQYISTDYGSEFFARRDGFLLTDSDAVVFLDADDRLTPDYIRDGLDVLGEQWQVGVVGTDIKTFGGTERVWKHIAGPISRRNGVHAGSMVRSSAIRLAGMFDDPPPSPDTHVDWWQWRKLLDYGYKVGRSPSLYEYRKGHDSMSKTKTKRQWYDRAAEGKSRVSILIPLSGRDYAWDELSQWLDRQTWPRDQVHLRLLDNSHNPAFSIEVREWVARSGYPDVRYAVSNEGRRGLADESRNRSWREVQRVVCRLWSQLTRKIDAPWALTMEDDVIPPDDVVERLLRRVNSLVDAVACPYLARDGKRFVVRIKGMPVYPGDFSGVHPVESAGFGCLLVRSDLLESHTFTYGPRGERHWYDWWFAESQSLHLLCDFDLLADHLAARSPDTPTGALPLAPVAV